MSTKLPAREVAAAELRQTGICIEHLAAQTARDEPMIDVVAGIYDLREKLAGIAAVMESDCFTTCLQDVQATADEEERRHRLNAILDLTPVLIR